MTFISIVLAIMFIICFTRWRMLKRDIRLLRQAVSFIRDNSTNVQLTTTTFDPDICVLMNEINTLIEHYKQERIQSDRTNREMRQAITNISHDLRTPLTSAMGYLQMMSSDKTEPHKKTEYQHIVEKRLQSLNELMNDLLEYSKIMEGIENLSFEKINIGNELRDIVASFYDQFLENSFEIQLNIPDTPIYIVADKKALRRITTNLIQNVLTHGIELFDLSLSALDGSILLRNKIKQTDNMDVEKLFNRFYTADPSRTVKSTGLGLAIAKELVSRMGGTIDASVQEDYLSIQISGLRKYIII